jgi:hypothetical protein
MNEEYWTTYAASARVIARIVERIQEKGQVANFDLVLRIAQILGLDCTEDCQDNNPDTLKLYAWLSQHMGYRDMFVPVNLRRHAYEEGNLVVLGDLPHTWQALDDLAMHIAGLNLSDAVEDVEVYRLTPLATVHRQELDRLIARYQEEDNG